MELNVNFSEDARYRYKMPYPYIQNVGRGNGKRFIFSNIDIISKKMFKTPDFLSKFLQSEMGTHAYLNQKLEYESTGWVYYAEMLKKLEKFSKTYVLCKYCGNPETSVEICQNSLNYHCNACGTDYQLPKSDYYPLVKMLVREYFKPSLDKRSKIKVEEIKAKISTLCQLYENKYEILKKQFYSYVQEEAMLEEEIPAVLVAGLYQKYVPDENSAKLLNEYVQQLGLDYYYYLAILFSLECLYRYYESLFQEKQYFLAGIFQQLAVSGNFKPGCFVDFYEKYQNYVPKEYHQMILDRELKVFYDWFWNAGIEESFEGEEET